MKGRKPKPTALKLLEGNPGKRKLNADEPSPRGTTVRCERPDRHVPKLMCGHPLPCPHHTVVIDGDRMKLPSEPVGVATVRLLDYVFQQGDDHE